MKTSFVFEWNFLSIDPVRFFLLYTDKKKENHK